MKKCRLAFFASLVLVIMASVRSYAAEPIDIGSRRQLFVGQHLIGSMEGVRQVLHHPVRREIAIKPEHPWEDVSIRPKSQSMS